MAHEQASEFPVSFRVLVVTSDQNCRENVEALLSQCKFQVTTTGLGAEAIALFKKDKDKFDIVICDEYVVDMDVGKLVRFMGYRMMKPTVYIATGDYHELARAMQRGPTWRFSKPLKIENLKHISDYLLWLSRARIDAVEIKEDNCTKYYDENQGLYFDLLKMMPADDVWPLQVHQKFVAAIKALGKTRRNTVMDFKNVEGLSKGDVESTNEIPDAGDHTN